MIKINRILAVIMITAAVATAFVACKKEEDKGAFNESIVSLLPTRDSRDSSGGWEEHSVPGERVLTYDGKIKCIGKEGTCFKYYIWVEDVRRNLSEDAYLYFPATDYNSQNEMIHVSKFSYDETNGELEYTVAD